MINLSWMPILKSLCVAVVLFVLVGYIYVLRENNTVLEASVESYKLQSQNNALVANQNAQAVINQRMAYQDLLNTMIDLEDEIATLKSKQHKNEIEVVKYVSELPNGFEKQCFNMLVPNNVGRLQK